MQPGGMREPTCGLSQQAGRSWGQPDPGGAGEGGKQPRQRRDGRLIVGPGWQDSGLVFTWGDGRPLHPERFSRWFERLAREAGLPRIRLHDVRHSYATAALAASVVARLILDDEPPDKAAR